MDIDALNCLTEDIMVIPKYVPKPKFRCIKAYYALDHDVIIVGEADPNFIFWRSVTKMDDTETNRMIIGHVSQMTPLAYGQDSTVISKKTKYDYQQFRHFYCAEITCEEDIAARFQQIKAQSNSRVSDGRLIAQMEEEMRVLSRRTSDPVSDYRKNEALIQDIQSRKDLRLSDNPQVRELYARLYDLSYSIYNAYMTEVR